MIVQLGEEAVIDEEFVCYGLAFGDISFELEGQRLFYVLELAREGLEIPGAIQGVSLGGCQEGKGQDQTG